MSSSDSKKNKRKKNRKGGKANNLSGPEKNIQPPDLLQNLQDSSFIDNQEDLAEIEKLMDADTEPNLENMPPLSRGPNPYLGAERCLLCRCERPMSMRTSTDGGLEDNKAGTGYAQLWVCADCRRTVEEEDRKEENAFMGQEFKVDPILQFLPEMNFGTAEPTTPNGSICTCDACLERRQIEGEHQKETHELQQLWMELRHVTRCIYRQSGTGLEEGTDDTIIHPDINKMKEIVKRLCVTDPHQLFQRLESQGREYVIEVKVRLLKQLNMGYKSPPQAKAFVSLLLEEYQNLCTAAKKLSAFLVELEVEHLKRFQFGWELHNKHLFHSIIFTDPLVHNNVQMLIMQLRLGAASKESYHEDTYPNLLHRYLTFESEMNVVSVVWRDCQQLLEEYTEQEAALKAKQKMLKEDWEFFKQQRKLLEAQVLKTNKTPTSTSHIDFEAQFTETMRNLLQGTKLGTKPDENHIQCPSCNHKRCPCDECTIAHMITCGIISPELSDNMSGHTPLPPFNYDASRYHVDVTPPSMSSTASSSGRSSPVLLDTATMEEMNKRAESVTERGDECNNVEASQISDNNPDDSHDVQPPLSNEIDGDDSDDESDVGDTNENSDVDNDEDDSEEEEEEDNSCGDGEQVDEVTVKKNDICDCNHCVSAAKILDQKKTETVVTQCQCHACVQQSEPLVTVPQHFPIPNLPPRPAALHLYPHIHGSQVPNLAQMPILHSTQQNIHRPLLHPQLYDLHSSQALPRPQPAKPIPKAASMPPGGSSASKHPFNLDIDTPQQFSEHIYNAYGEWDNSYVDPKIKSVLASSMITTAQTVPPMANGMGKIAVPLNMALCGIANNEHIHNETCFMNLRPINRNHYQAGHSHSTKSEADTWTHNSLPIAGLSKADVECLKNNPFSHLHHSSYSNTPQQPLPMKLTPDIIQNAALSAQRKDGDGACHDGGGAPVIPQLPTSLNHTCSHQMYHQNHQNSLAAKHHVDGRTCSNMNSVGTSTQGTDQDYDHHHGDEYDDSIDDSCSEQSSSTSTSNQKDGKYCDCCYCEFFGQGNPPVAPTSKNYAEMRDRLRLRLKRKNEMKGVCLNHQEEFAPPPPVICSIAQPIQDIDPVEKMGGLEELVKFINGSEASESKISAKAAKRARQKQRKAEDKARKLAEEERYKREAEEELKRQQQQSRKKGKHKEANMSQNNQNVEPRAKKVTQCINQGQGHQGKVEPLQPNHNSNNVTPEKREMVSDKTNKAKHKEQDTRLDSPKAKTRRGNESCPSSQIQQAAESFKQRSTTDKQPTLVKQQQTPTKKIPLEQTEAKIAKKVEPNSNHVSLKQPQSLPSPALQKKNQNQQNQKAQKAQVNNMAKVKGQMREVPQNGNVTENNLRNKIPEKISVDNVTITTKVTVSPPENHQSNVQQQNGKTKKNKKKKGQEKEKELEEIFLPRADLDDDIDDAERELEEFKRFCFTKPTDKPREKLAVNFNLKDIFTKKKASQLGCA